MQWLVAVIEGILLALIFYALVRLRMSLAPWMRDRFGERARWTTWVVTIGVMVLCANGGLILLRRALHEQYGIDTPFLHEMLYAMVSFAVGFALVSRHVTRNRNNAQQK